LCTILLEEHLQIASEMLEVGTCSPVQSPKLTTVVQYCSAVVTVLSREDGEVPLHDLQTMTEQFRCVNEVIVILENCIVGRT
jgi:hypothetical protein